MLLALKRVPGETASSLAAAGAAGSTLRLARRSWRSSSWTRRFKAAISERCVVEDFLRDEVSRRISLREMREISSFKTEAMFGMMGASSFEGRDLKLPQYGQQ